jgi:hypothetical protein
LVRRRSRGIGLLKRHPISLAAVSITSFPTGAIDENPPHRAGRHSKEMFAAGELIVADQAQKCLVNERRGLKRLARLLRGQAGARELAQLVVHERKEFRSRVRLSRGGRVQKARDVRHGG